MNIVLAILIFGIIIIVHELGHFLVAKKNKVGVDEFSIGFGPKIIYFYGKETKYSLRILPLGGYCKMSDEDSDSNQENLLQNKSKIIKACVIFAGPAFNIIFALFVSILLINFTGYKSEAKINSIDENSIAFEYKLMENDTIIKVNNFRVNTYMDLIMYLQTFTGEDINLLINRDNDLINVKINNFNSNNKLGIVLDAYVIKADIFDSVKYGINNVRFYLVLTCNSLVKLFTGVLSVDDMSGPVGMINGIGSEITYQVENNYTYLSIMANLCNIMVLLSVNIGVMNLLPFPVLDGGQLVMIGIEGILKRDIKETIKQSISIAGMLFLFIVMVFFVFNDLKRII